jgi:hypothetical protein
MECTLFVLGSQYVLFGWGRNYPFTPSGGCVMLEPSDMESCWWFGDQPRIPIPGAKGFNMFVGDSIQDVIVFLGWRDAKVPGGIKCEGTGFLQLYDGHGYIVTVRHVAKKLGSDPFVVRVNNHRGAARLIDADEIKWFCPDDALIDLAITPAKFDGPLFFPQHLIYSNERCENVGIGDICYTAGLFHFIAGHKRNLPFLFTGHIALMPPHGETIPIGNDRDGIDHVEGYLVENNAIKGASGSPVFVRPSTHLTFGGTPLGVMAGKTDIYLWGIYQAAWFLPADAILAEGVQARPNDVVPVGVGVVVPIATLVELLERQDLKEMRDKTPRVEVIPARLAGLSSKNEESFPPASDVPPSDRERFNSLLSAAARKHEPED